jgi:hypothetical protein
VQTYQPNSHRFKEEQKNAPQDEKRIEKVVRGPVKTKKKNGLSKAASLFISEDIDNVGEYLLTDWVVPTVKKAILGALDMILNGGRSSYSGRQSGSKVTYRSYGKYYDDPGYERRSAGTARPRFDYDDIVFANRGEAEAVREEMDNVIERYGFVTVADMYDMAELPQPYTSNKFGWTSIRNAEVVRDREGYILKLPKAMPIER